MTPAFLENRREILEGKVKNLKTIGELRRALALEEWKDNPSGQVINEELRAIDADMRKLVAQRLTKAIQIEAEKGDAASRMALANLICEMGPTIRSVGGDKKGFARSLTKEVIQLAQDKNYAVRQQALRALGNIFPDPKEASAVFQAALEKENPDLKLLAAKGLGQLIRNVDFLQKQKGTSASGVDADQGDVLDAVLAVLGANGAGLKSSDARVRAQSLRNIQAGADAMAGIIKNPFLVGITFPSESRRLTPEEKAFILSKHDDVTFEIKSYLPIINALRDQAPMLARSLDDSDSQVRLAALEALENIAIARIRLKKRVQSVPMVPDEKSKDDRGNRELLKANDPLELFVGKNLGAILNLLRDPDPRARRMAVEFLELIEDAATPALPLLVTSLTDEDRYVRRSAARTIANIAPEKAALAVPGLANLLNDSDLNVRRAAAKTLAEMGPLAQAAVPALAKAVVSGDPVARVDAMEALRSIGPDAGKAAVPQLIEALRNPDPRVKSQAAKVLGSFKGVAAAAIPGLQHALGDDMQEVRDSASQAILEINQGNQEY